MCFYTGNVKLRHTGHQLVRQHQPEWYNPAIEEAAVSVASGWNQP